MPLIKKAKDWWKFLYVLPFSIVYVPVYTYLGIAGLIKMIFIYNKLEHGNKR